MCLPKPPNPAPAAVPVPTDQAASAFNFGGDTPGANIGRLALRLTSGNQSSGAQAASSTTNSAPATPAAQPSTPPPSAAPGGSTQTGQQTSTDNVGAYGAAQRGGFAFAPNVALRQTAKA